MMQTAKDTRKRGYTERTRICILCGNPIVGYKPVGSTKIYNRKGEQIGEAAYAGRMGYAHLSC